MASRSCSREQGQEEKWPQAQAAGEMPSAARSTRCAAGAGNAPRRFNLPRTCFTQPADTRAAPHTCFTQPADHKSCTTHLLHQPADHKCCTQPHGQRTTFLRPSTAQGPNHCTPIQALPAAHQRGPVTPHTKQRQGMGAGSCKLGEQGPHAANIIAHH